MQRALSAENLAEIAHGAFKGLRRLVSPGSAVNSQASDASPSLSDLLSTMKVVEESGKRGQKLDPSVVDLHLSSLGLELEYLQSAEDPLAASGTPSSPLTAASASAFPSSASRPAPGGKRPMLTDQQLLASLECIKTVCRKLPPAAVAERLVEHRVFERCVLLLFMSARPLSKRAHDAVFGATVHHLSESLNCFLATADVFVRLLTAAASTADAAEAVPRKQFKDEAVPSPLTLRVMLLLFYALRRADTINVSHANEVKCKLQQGGLLAEMCSRAIAFAARHKAQPTDDAAGLVLTCGVLALATAGAICRSNMPHKELVAKTAGLLPAWVYLGCNIARISPALSHPSSSGDKGKMDVEVLWPGETSTEWAAELAEFLVELSTTDSFSLRRQAHGHEGAHTVAPSTPPNQLNRPPLSTGPLPAAERLVRKWEPLPPDWDTTLSGGAVAVWELTAQVSHCVLSLRSATAIVELLPLIDASSPQTEYIYRAVISSLVLLCQATPQNVVLLQEAGAFSTLISLLTDPSASTFPLDTKLKPAFLMRLGDNSWHVTMGLLTVLAATHFTKSDLQLLVSAVDTMRQCETTAEDCEIIEQLLMLAGRSRYAKAMLWFSGAESAVSCSLDKFAGRWYGYSVAAWLNPSCIWGEGCSIFSFFESSTSLSVAVTIVANGRHKSLAVRTISVKELTIAVLPDTTIPDGWCHVALVHNISGFTVYINGRKCVCSPNVPFPREPSKQNKLILSFGGEAALPQLLASPPPKSPIPSFFGTICGPTVLDGALSEKDVERLAACLPGHPIDGPPLSNVELLGVHVVGDAASPAAVAVEITGSSAKKEQCVVLNVVAYATADTAQAFADLSVLEWVITSLELAGDSPNRNIIAVLLVEFLNVFVKICRDGVLLLAERSVMPRIRAVLVQWESLPSQIHVSLLAVTIPKGAGKKMRPHVTTNSVLSLVMELINTPNCSAGTKSGVLKELSDYLTVAENVKQFREGAKFESVIALGRTIPVECVDDLVMLVEKLCKEPPEMELLVKFLLFEPKSAVVAKCEMLRMLYDVSKSNQSITETIGNVLGGNGIVALLYLVQGTQHQSEVLRIYAVRLLALILHCSRRHRDQFTRLNGYELLTAALVQSRYPAGPPVRLATFNCLFKFALGFFQPASALDSVHSSVMTKIASAPPQQLKRSSPGSSSTQHSDPHFSVGASLGFHGHLPSLMPSNGGGARRVYSVDLSSAECGDVESRLSVDDNYNSQSSQSDTLVHPQLIHVVLALLGRVVAQTTTPPSDVASTPSEPQTAAAADPAEVHSSASVSTKREEDAPEILAMKVLQYLDRMVDLVPNAVELLPHPWLEWLWACVEPVLTTAQQQQQLPSAADPSAAPPRPPGGSAVETVVRSFIRKMAVVDLSRGPKQSYLRRAKELCDAPMLQHMVLEEAVRHFSMNNRLDTMDAQDAQNVIRNVDTLFQGLEEVLVPFPAALGIEIAHAVGAIAINNNAWVRQKMKQQSKLFDTRDRLAFATLLATAKEFSKQDVSFLQELVDANIQDPNTSLVLLRALVDSVKDRHIDEVEAIQLMLRRVFAVDEEQRKTMQKTLAEHPEVLDLIVAQRRVLQGSEVPMPDMISWCMANDGRWEQVGLKISRAAKLMETEHSARVERRKKERAERLKSRRVELDKKQTAHAKTVSDYEKLRVEAVENRMAGYRDSEGRSQQ